MPAIVDALDRLQLSPKVDAQVKPLTKYFNLNMYHAIMNCFSLL